jgi:Lrp/AsnC family leucine-responsive transcriptional regulator
MFNLDKIDRKILDRLQVKGRISNQALSEHIGLSTAACLKRVQRLESQGLIRGYAGLLDSEKLGLRMLVMVEVSLSSHSAPLLESFEAAVGLHPEILECHMMSGEADYLLKVITRDASTYESLYRRVLSALPGVSRIQSSFAIRSLFQRTALPLT